MRQKCISYFPYYSYLVSTFWALPSLTIVILTWYFTDKKLFLNPPLSKYIINK